MISFLLNDSLHQIEDIDPNTTVLQYLREHLQKNGTKEGCASGDCGACTVVIGELVDEGIRYRTINACIALLATLHGKQLIVVEDLKQEDELHPVQQAMVECNGSQCGFCTPGFVMSLFALGKNLKVPNRKEIEEALAGNLCRCTGYRPIIESAIKMYDAPEEDKFSCNESVLVDQLKAIGEQNSVELSLRGKQYFAPKTILELTELLALYPNARLLAGGSDLNLEITQLLNSFETIIYVGDVTEMTKVEETEEHYLIGAAVKYSDCYDLIEKEYPDLAEVFLRLGSKQIRNVGTIGGNVGNASPIADTPPALIAVGAKLHLRKAGRSRILPVEDYFIDYKQTALDEGEFISAIELPKTVPDFRFKMYKVSKRIDDDISAVCGAFYLRLEGGRISNVNIVYGGMAAIPKRASHCEKSLIGEPLSDATIEQGMLALENDFNPIGDVRASAEYRMLVAKNLLEKCYLELVTPHEIMRVTDYA